MDTTPLALATRPAQVQRRPARAGMAAGRRPHEPSWDTPDAARRTLRTPAGTLGGRGSLCGWPGWLISSARRMNGARGGGQGFT